MSSPPRPVRDAFKEAMAHVATPVAIVTCMRQGVPYGTTVSAFTSLSMSPPLVLVSLDHGSETRQIVSATRTFGLNVLSNGQQATALKFAGKGGATKFDDVCWDVDHELPRIAGASGWFACSVDRLIEAGDHQIVVGEVQAAQHFQIDPLTYYRRAFGTHRTLEPIEQPPYATP